MDGKHQSDEDDRFEPNSFIKMYLPADQALEGMEEERELGLLQNLNINSFASQFTSSKWQIASMRLPSISCENGKTEGLHTNEGS